MKDITDIKKQLKDDLTKKRYEHSLGVMYTAASMAMCHNVDLEKTIMAGLLHDCAKCLTDKEKINLCKKYNVSISKAEEKNKELLHAKLGAVVAKYKYHIEDEDILSAITWHTTGKANMTKLEEIIFIADYIEPNRKMLEGMEEIRYLAFHDLTGCIVKIIENTLQYLEGKKSLIDDSSKATYQYYKQKQESNHE